MRKLVVGTFLTLDGVMQGPGGPEEDTEGGFDLGGWQMPLFDDESGQTVDGWMQDTGSLLLGRKTYDIFAGFWPKQPADDETASHLNRVEKYVTSRTMDEAEWENTTVLKGDAAETVRQLKEGEGGEIHVTGSSDLIQTLIANDLVDEFRLIIYPIVLGEGKKLFGDGTIPTSLELVSTARTSKGATVCVYRRTGRPEFGSF